jgi:hypothetical protein
MNRDPRFAELDAAIALLPSERHLWLGRRQSAGRKRARWWREPRRNTPDERRRAYLIETGRVEQLEKEGLAE